MQIGRIPGCTRVIGKSQGYLDLPLRDNVDIDKTNEQEPPTMTSAWLLTPKELAILNAGGALHVTIFGNIHPPIRVECGEPPDE